MIKTKCFVLSTLRYDVKKIKGNIKNEKIFSLFFIYFFLLQEFVSFFEKVWILFRILKDFPKVSKLLLETDHSPLGTGWQKDNYLEF